MTSGLTAVNLFAGIEGFGLATHRAGIKTVAAVEINDQARGVIADRFPDTALFNDVCEVTADDLRAAGFVPERGILTGGWPCQDLSLAGRRLGLGGARSGLFWEIVRLLADLRPRWFVLENVPGLLSSVCPCIGDGSCGADCPGDSHLVRGGACGPGRCMELHGGAMGAVLGALADLGYGVCWRVLDAQHFGVPQRRRRVVFVGCLGDGAAPAEVLLEPEGRGRDSAPGRAPWAGTSAVAALRASNGGADDNDATGGRLIAAPLRAANPYGDQVAAESHLIAGPLQAAGSGGRGHRVDAEGAANGHLVVAPALTARYGKGTDSDATDGLLPVAFDTAQITSAVNRVNPRPGDPAMPLAATGQPHVAYALRRDAGGTGQGHNTKYVPVALGGESVTHALTAEGHDASEDGTGRGTPLVPAVDATAVRRLTPVECERLQGFPDGWTATSWGKPQSDSARYRELGNSIAVPVFTWVARRVVAVDQQMRELAA